MRLERGPGRGSRFVSTIAWHSLRRGSEMGGAKMDRRSLVLGAAAASMALARPAIAQARQVIVCSWGGSYQRALREAFFAPFEAASGIKVIDTSAPVVAQVRAQVAAGNPEWDIIEGGSRWYPVLDKLGLIEPLDLGRIGVADLRRGTAVSHGVAPTIVSCGLGYNKVRAGEGARNWVEFWDAQKFPGARSLGADPTYNFEFALIADGVPFDKLYPIDLDRAFAKLEQIRPHIKVWWQQGDQPAQMLARGEVLYSSGWAGRLLQAAKDGLPIGTSLDQASWSPSFFMIMKGAKHQPEAYEFLRFCMEPAPQAELARLIPTGISNVKAEALLTQEQRKTLLTTDANMRNQWELKGEWLAEHYDAINDRWQKFMLG
jgi:putative spermidine/putrescine transport system substrate-binding protein